MSPLPTLVFVHGSWHAPSTWDKLVAVLEPKGYRCICPALPSTHDNPAATFKDDLDIVREAITNETTAGHDVVIIAHSYGGVVGQSAVKGLAPPKADQAASTTVTNGHVVGLILVGTGLMPSGISFMQAAGGQPPPSWKADQDSGYAVLQVDTRELFYHDLPTAEGELWVSRLQTQSLKALYEGGEHAHSGWQDVPTWYLITLEDRALPLVMQQAMAPMAKAAGVDIMVRELQSGHSPMLSRPAEMSSVIEEAAKDMAAKARTE